MSPNIINLHWFVCSILVGFGIASGVKAEDRNKPNFIIIFADDQGYNDLGCFGSETIKTPNIDRLATEGRKFISFYVACSVCSPSRAASVSAAVLLLSLPG